MNKRTQILENNDLVRYYSHIFDGSIYYDFAPSMLFSLPDGGRELKLTGIKKINTQSNQYLTAQKLRTHTKLAIFSMFILISAGCSSVKHSTTDITNPPIQSGSETGDSKLKNMPKIKTTASEALTNLYKNIPSSFLLEEYVIRSEAFPLKEIGTNASGITWDPFRKEYFVIQNNTGMLYRYDQAFTFLGKVKKVGNMNNDTEGVSYSDGQSLIIVTEANYAHRVQMSDDTIDAGYYYGESNIQLSGRPKKKNKGFEAVATRVASKNRSARIYAGQEGSGRYPEAKMKVVYYDASTDSGTYYLSSQIIKIEEPFDAELKFKGIISDLAGMVFEPSGKSLVIVSQESKKAIQVNPETGEVLSQLKLSGAPAYEGVTFGPNGELVFISERNLVQIYKRK